MRNHPSIKSRSVLWNLLRERIDKDILRNGNRQRTTQRVKKHDARIRSRHVLLGRYDLHGDKRDLDACASTDTSEDLVSDPLARGRSDFERVQQACADGEDGATEPHEGGVPADDGDEGADDDGGAGDADKVGDGADAGFFGRSAFDGLEIEGEVEDVSS